MNRILRTAVLPIICGSLVLSGPVDLEAEKAEPIEKKSPVVIVIETETQSETDILEQEAEQIYTKASASTSDIELLALLTIGEAEGESELGQRLVIDTVLNRVDSSEFPNTISGVIYEKGQYSCMWDGRINKVNANSNVRQLVQEELNNRYNNDVIFFRTNHYHSFGTPLFQVGCHYFSGK